MRAWLLPFVLAGCSFQANPAAGTGSAGDNGAIDAPPGAIDAAIDGPVQPVCLGSLVSVCVDPPRQVAAVPAALDTDTSTACVAFTSTPSIDACVIAGTSIAIAATTHVTGKKKLILWSASSITVDDTLDVASHKGASAGGPGADVDPCAKAKDAELVGGGAGGSFGTKGGNGGDTPVTHGGQAGDVVAATTLRGGCAGGDGNTGGGHGRGGGGVLLLAATTIAINGTIDASGASGRGSSGGGGGGGSGGMIVLDAPAGVTVGGTCYANGGGGGGGGLFNVVAGADGTDSDAPDHAARGGIAGSVGGGGGDGALAAGGSTPGAMSTHTGGPPPHFDGSGGGGGGGAGVIEIFTTAGPSNANDGTAISPAPTVMPSSPIKP